MDHHTLAAQGIDHKPEPKLGAAAQAMERRGIETVPGQLFRDVQERNAERALQAETGAQQEQGAALEP